MRKIELGKEFFISAFIALLCSICLLLNFYQEDKVDAACEVIVNGDVDSLGIYLDEIWNINSLNSDGKTMLMVACENGNIDAMECLLNKGANANASPNGALTPLELYCRDSYEIGEKGILLLLDAGARQSIYTVKPAIFYLAENYYWMNSEQKRIATEETIWLLQHGAPLGYGKTSLLHLAARGNMSELFYTVVHTTQGLNMMSMKDENGMTPWDVAIDAGAVAVQQVIRNLEKEYEEETTPPSTEFEESPGSEGEGYTEEYWPEDPVLKPMPTESPIISDDRIDFDDESNGSTNESDGLNSSTTGSGIFG